MHMSVQDKKRVAWVAGVWAVFVVVCALFQEDVVRALILGLVQEAFLGGLGLLAWYLVHRKDSSADDMPET